MIKIKEHNLNSCSQDLDDVCRRCTEMRVQRYQRYQSVSLNEAIKAFEGEQPTVSNIYQFTILKKYEHVLLIAMLHYVESPSTT